MESLVLQWIWDISGWLWTKNLQRPLNAFLFWKESISQLPKHCRRSGIAPSPLVWLIPQPSWKPKILGLWKRKMWPKWSTRNSWRGRAPESSNLVCRSIEIDLKQERFVTYLLVEWKTIMKWCCPNTLLRQLPQHPLPRSIGHLGLSWSQEIWISPFIWDYLLFGDGAPPTIPQNFLSFFSLLTCEAWIKEFPHLVFRTKRQHLECSVCQRHRLLLRSFSHNLLARREQTVHYHRHIRAQYLDRIQYWSIRQDSRQHSKQCLAVILDGMDQAKFAYPRCPVMGGKQWANLARPRCHIVGIKVHGYECFSEFHVLAAPKTPTTILSCWLQYWQWSRKGMTSTSEECTFTCKVIIAWGKQKTILSQDGYLRTSLEVIGEIVQTFYKYL